ncbi:MAG: AsmA family protein [Chitinophagaceae bacterium]|nr:MAG: AsmA family protein [Chitinophagaceae bacterium]
MKKTIIIISAIFGFLLLLAILLPFLFKDRLMVMLKEEINKQVEAKVDFSDLGISIFRNFPDLTLSMRDFSVVGEKEFEGDTLAYIKSFRLTVDLMSAIRGDEIELKRIRLDEPLIQLLVNQDGNVNWDIMPESDEEVEPTDEESGLKFALRSYELRNADIRYYDIPQKMYASLTKMNHSGRGDFTLSQFLLSTDTRVESINVSYDGFSWFRNVSGELLADMDINLDASTYTFSKFDLTLNELFVQMTGMIGLPESGFDLDLDFKTPDTEFKQLLSIIPAAYTDDFRNINAGGSFSLNGFVKGLYEDELYPAFEIKMKADNGSFQYPDLPAKVSNVDLDMEITHPGGIYDLMVIDLKKLSMKLDNEPFDMRLKMRNPDTDPDIDMALSTKLNLSKVPNYYPIDGLETISGNLEASIEAKGRLSAIEHQRYNQFHASGFLQLNNFAYKDADLPYLLEMSIFDLQISPATANLRSMKGKIGSTDFDMSGRLDNLLPYVFNDGILKGSFAYKSTLTNVNEWMTGEAEPDETAEMSVIPVPANLDIRMTGDFTKIIYDNIEMENVTGIVQIKDQKINLSNLNARTLNATVRMNGEYNTRDVNNPTFNMDYDINNMDIREAYETFNTVESFAPVARYVEGRFSSVMNMNANLNPDMYPDMNSLNARGNLRIPEIKVNNFKPLQELADKMQLPFLRNWSASNLRIDFIIENGRLIVEPFDVMLSDVLVNVSGSNGLDQSLDYILKVNVPRARLGRASDLASSLAEESGIPGLASALPDVVQFNVNMKGTIDNPNISLSLGEATTKRPLVDRAREEVGEQVDRARAEAEAEAERLRKEAEQKARAEADRARAQAEAEAERARKEAQAEADRIRKEAEERARKEAEKQKEGLRDRIGFP